MGRVVIACYSPKPGRESDLHELPRSHVPRLRAEGLATEREPFIAVASDGTVVEVFEWVSQEAIAAAHENASVRAMWDEYEEVCTYLPLGQLSETAGLFSEFDALP
ncbi:MAG: hypothetical protein IPL45_01540 [Actinomycetales bacterium]|nr:hypothetical protein [Actinomycetales bacterium]